MAAAGPTASATGRCACSWPKTVRNGKSSVSADRREATSSKGPSSPHRPKREWRRHVAHLQRMQELRETVAGLEKEGLTGGEPESKALIDFHVADAERRLRVATTRQAASGAVREAIGNAAKANL